MIAELGHYALLLAFAVSLAQGAFGILGAHRDDARWMEAASRAALIQAASIALSFLALTAAHVRDDFSLQNVFENSHSLKPLLYKIAGVWGNHEGSMLLWVLVLSVFGALLAAFARSVRLELKSRVLGVQGALGALFLLFIAATSNPFWRLDPAPLEGQDLNPLLQDPGLAFHPPLLYLGYVGLSMTFAFAVAGLIEARIDAAWARAMRPWALGAWTALTLGIALGSWWAYYELGWGGFWFWDPVENASLMPWLAATALLHSALVVERREILKRWTVFLAILAFSLSLIGTFLVRSGVLTSVHAFANDPARGLFILLIIVTTIGGALVLYALRAGRLKGEAGYASVSRETALLMNNVFLAAAAATVFIGTLYPLILSTLGGPSISVGPPYFNLTFVPLMTVLFIIVPFGPVLAWRRGDAGDALRVLSFAAVIAIICAILAWAFISSEPVIALLGVALGVWLIAGSVAMILRRVFAGGFASEQIRARLRALTGRDIGTTLAHAGLGIAILGAIGATLWRAENVTMLAPGGATDIGAYHVVLENVVPFQGPNYIAERATLTVTRGNRFIATLKPENRIYPAAQSVTTEAAIRTNGLSDLYAVLGDRKPDGRHVMRFYINPLAPWLWFGALIMACGGVVSLFGLKTKRRAAAAPSPAE